MKDLLHFNKAVKDARAKYFLELMSANQHNSRFFFNTIDRFVNSVPACVSASSADCEKLSSFFVEKIDKIRSKITCPVHCTEILYQCINVLNSFMPVFHIKPTSSPLDLIPTRVFKKIIGVIGPDLLFILNCSALEAFLIILNPLLCSLF